MPDSEGIFFFILIKNVNYRPRIILCKHRCLDILRLLAWQKDLCPLALMLQFSHSRKGVLDEFHSRFMFRSFAVLLNSRLWIMKTELQCWDEGLGWDFKVLTVSRVLCCASLKFEMAWIFTPTILLRGDI